LNLAKHKELILSLGCILDDMTCRGAIVPHHPRFAAGLAQKSSDWLRVPLCFYHHTGGNIGQAIHSGRQTFELNYASEPDMLALTIERLLTLLEGG